MNTISRKHIELALQFCIEKWGESRYNKGYPKLRIFSKRNPEGILGQYKPDFNQLNIYLVGYNLLQANHLLELCGTVIHEYTHYMQCMHKYRDYVEIHKYSYERHPYEKTALNRELKYRRYCKNYVLKNL